MARATIRPEDAAREMGISATQVRNLMRLGRLNPPIGYAYKTTARRWRYTIYRDMLDEYLHKKAPVVTEATVQAIQEENRILAELVKASQEEGAALRGLVEKLLAREAEVGG